MDAEFWRVSPGDVIRAPFWPAPVRVEAAEQLDGRFTRVHWTGILGGSGVSVITEHTLITFIRRWVPDRDGRYRPPGMPAGAALADAARTQYLAGITGTRDNAALIKRWAVEADMLALSRGEYRTQQPCGCAR